MEVHRMSSFDTRYISWFEWGIYIFLGALSVTAMFVVVVNPQQRIYRLGGENDLPQRRRALVPVCAILRAVYNLPARRLFLLRLLRAGGVGFIDGNL